MGYVCIGLPLHVWLNRGCMAARGGPGSYSAVLCGLAEGGSGRGKHEGVEGRVLGEQRGRA